MDIGTSEQREAMKLRVEAAQVEGGVLSPDTAFEVHEAAKLIRDMTEDEFTRLKADIKERGQLLPIIMLDGKILDGRHRYRACKELKILPRCTHDGSGMAPDVLVRSLNEMRRHLSKGQIAVEALKELPEAEEVAKERQIRKPADSVGDSSPTQNQQTSGTRVPEVQRATNIVAAQRGISGRLLRRAKKIQESAPFLLSEIENDVLSIGQALRIMKDTLILNQLKAGDVTVKEALEATKPEKRGLEPLAVEGKFDVLLSTISINSAKIRLWNVGAVAKLDAHVYIKGEVSELMLMLGLMKRWGFIYKSLWVDSGSLLLCGRRGRGSDGKAAEANLNDIHGSLRTVYSGRLLDVFGRMPVDGWNICNWSRDEKSI